MRLTNSTQLHLLANHRFVAVSEGGTQPATLLPIDHKDVFTCGWQMAAGYTEDGDAVIVECGAVAVGFDNGFMCDSGHDHRFDAEYYTEEEMEGAHQAGHLAPNARLV